MYFKRTISTLALLAVLCGISVSYAQDTAAPSATPAVPPAVTNAPTDAPAMPTPTMPMSGAADSAQSSMPMLTTTVPTPVDASTVAPSSPVVAPATTNTVPMDASNQVMLQSVMLVNLPRADGAIVDKLVEAVASRDWEKYSALYSKESFNLVTVENELISTPEALKAMWDKKMSDARYKDHKATATVDSVKEIAPGIGYIVGKLNIVFDANHSAMAHFTMLTKYEENTWKIASMHASSKDVMKMILAEEMKPESNVMMDAVYAILGLIIGFVLAKLMLRKAA